MNILTDRKLRRRLSAYFKNISVSENPQAKAKTLERGWVAMEKAVPPPVNPNAGFWEETVFWRPARVVALAAGLMILLAVFLPFRFSQPAWAIEQSIAAIKGLQAMRLEGVFVDETGQSQEFELWMRADRKGRQSKDFHMKSSSGVICWVSKDSTYYYVPTQETVFFERASTQGMSPWPGPHLLELLSKTDNARVNESYDPGTERKCITLSSSIVDVKGPQSWIMSFDLETKKPVSFKTWGNLDHSGPPTFWARHVTYMQDLPDSQLIPVLPAHLKYVEKEPSIPVQSISVLASPRFGLPVGEMDLQAAATEVLHCVYSAIIRGDLSSIRKYCPITDLWNDQFLKGIMMGNDPADQIGEIVSIGQITKEGHSPVGTFVILPVTARRKDGSLWKDQMIVQFRGGPPPQSCVVYGPYGFSVEVE
jgi:hypothetical protein